MNLPIPRYLIDLFLISTIVSIVLMTLIQKFKSLTFINKRWQICILNLLFSFALGIPFSIYFYQLKIIDGVWVSILSFIIAPSIYDVLKKQNIINYKPISLSDNRSQAIEIPIENEIKRD